MTDPAIVAGRPATRDDVARRAGVSSAVVSYVLNDGPRPVSNAARQRVLDAVAELGYRPNAAARAFRLQRTQTIGLVLPEISNPFFAELAKFIQAKARDRGYAVVFVDTDGDLDREAEAIRFMVDRQVDGVLICGQSPQADFSPVLNARMPLVTFHRFSRDRSIPTVSIDDYPAVVEGVRHLCSHGHRRIGLISGPSELPDMDERRRAWADTIGLPESDLAALAVEGDISRAGGYRAAQELLSRDTRATAVFVATGTQSVGALRALHEAGIRVPEDMAMVSFDGTQETEFASPPLTAIRPSLETVAATAVDLLLDPDSRAAGIHRVIPHQFLLRASCGSHPLEDHASIRLDGGR